MAIGSISSGTVSTTVEKKRGESRPSAAEQKAAAEQKTVADHVAALDDQEPIRSASTTRGTLVDTYL
jgi:hypothetical protein